MKFNKSINKYIFLTGVIVAYLYGVFSQDRNIVIARDDSKKVSIKDNGIRICSQNLFRLGDRGVDSSEFNSQAEALVKRIKKASCDIVALQEIPGNMTQSKRIIGEFIQLLYSSFGKMASFKEILAQSNDSYIRNGLLYNELLFKVHNVRNMYHDSLPRLGFNSAPWSYARGPLMVELRLADANKKGLVLINYHQKSKSKGFKDKSGLDFELARLVAAGGIRERIEDFMKGNSESYVEVLLGDRNSESDSASALVLSGALEMEDFRGRKSCEILPNGAPECEQYHFSKPTFLPALEYRNKHEGMHLATHRYRNHNSILDEIYISSEDSDRIKEENGLIRAGTEGEFGEGSDHLLSWIEVSL